MKPFYALAAFLLVSAVPALPTHVAGAAGIGESMSEGKEIVLENNHARYVIGPDGANLHFIDKRTGYDYCAQKSSSYFAQVKKAGSSYNASAVSCADGRLTVEFGRSGVRTVIEAKAESEYFTLEVLSLTGEQVEELAFPNIRLDLSRDRDPFAGCALALNLKTNVREIPGPNVSLRAMCYPRFGFEGAKVAIIGCPHSQLRRVMQDAVSAAEDLPHSPLGGPWALDAEINRGSYIFNFGGLSEDKVDEWIQLARRYGINQIDFHGGVSFRFGDCRPNPVTYPNGRASLKAVIDKLHAAGITAGLHTYAFLMDKNCPWVTPIPDPRLGKDATFTLAEALTPDATSAPVVESTKDMSAIVGYGVRNSVTLQIDDELIIYSGVSKEPPYAFTGCQRGAHGTRIAPHAQGAKVHHLKECFGLFSPDGDSTLLTEVAAKTAETFNECGFDMIYLDALDAEDILGGQENRWHYGSKFVFEICKRLKKPALMEMSTFRHHLWYVRSRMEAWDHPRRGHKRFVDIHCAANEDVRRMLLPTHLGWWAVVTNEGPHVTQDERTYPDDIEYLMCKCLGGDAGISLVTFGPDTPAYRRLADIFRQYENLRHARYFPESIKSRLRVPGEEFTLEQSAGKKWQFRRVDYAKHKVESADGNSAWETKSKFGRQPVRLRIETLMSAGAYESPESVTIADFAKPDEFTGRAARSGVTADLKPSSAQVKAGAVSGCYTALSTRAHLNGAWAMVEKFFSPDLDISQQQALGVWVYGDGRGEILNFQFRSPIHIALGISDHFVKVDFTGWRYFELIEPEGGHTDDYFWPYEHKYGYAIYREWVNYGHIASLSIWYNNLPSGKEVACYISPVKALPLVKNKFRNPRIKIAGREIVFPTEIESGCWLEFNSMSDCKLYAPNGDVIGEVKPKGEAPILEAGGNQVEFECGTLLGASARAYVTVISRGELLRPR